MTNERYDFLMNRAEIAESRLREAEKLLDTFCTDWCEDGYEYADRDRIHGEGFRTSCEENRCHIWWAHQTLRGAGEEITGRTDPPRMTEASAKAVLSKIDYAAWRIENAEYKAGNKEEEKE